LPGVEEAYVKNGTVKKPINASSRERFSAIRIAVEFAEYEELLRGFCEAAMPVIAKFYLEETGEHTSAEPLLTAVNEWDLPEGKVGSFLFADEAKGRETGLLTVGPKNFDSGKWKWVTLHELVHAVIGKIKEPHGELFDNLSHRVGIPTEYRD
jgi:hypothetical protein